METSPSIPFPSHPTEAKTLPKKPESSFSSRIKAEREKKHFREQQMEEENKQIAESARSIQTELITTQTVQPLEQLLPPPLLSVYNQNKDFYGEKSIPFSDERGKGEYKLKATQNNIVMLQQRRRMRNVFFFFPRYSIDKFYYIDRESKKAWDIFQLGQNNSPYQLFHYPTYKNSGVLETKEGHAIIFNYVSELKNRARIRRKLNLSPEQEELMDILVPFHELGHHFQQPPSNSHDSLSTALIKQFLVEKTILPFLPLLAKIGLKLGEYEMLKISKSRGTWQERNADAFTLSMARKLKQQGVDLLRGYSVDEVTSLIDKELFTYDKGLGKYLPGLPYAQRMRKEYRKACLA